MGTDYRKLAEAIEANKEENSCYNIPLQERTVEEMLRRIKKRMAFTESLKVYDYYTRGDKLSITYVFNVNGKKEIVKINKKCR